MIELNGIWIGNTFGTHPSTVFAEFTKMTNETSKIRIKFTNNNEVRIFVGSYQQQENSITVTLNSQTDDSLTNVTGIINFQINSKNSLEGRYSMNTKEEGGLKITRFLMQNDIANNPELSQLISKEYPISYPVKIYKKDIKDIIKIMADLATDSGKVIITEGAESGKTSRYMEAYLKNNLHPKSIENITFTSQNIVDGLVNTASLTLNCNGSGIIISQSTNRIWAESATLVLKEYFEKRRSRLLTLYKKHGLEINAIAIFILLTILPSLSLKLRIATVIGLVVFIISHKLLHSYISKTIIQANNNEPENFGEKHPKITYATLTLLSAAVSAAITYSIDKFIPWIAHWISSYI